MTSHTATSTAALAVGFPTVRCRTSAICSRRNGSRPVRVGENQSRTAATIDTCDSPYV